MWDPPVVREKAHTPKTRYNFFVEMTHEAVEWGLRKAL